MQVALKRIGVPVLVVGEAARVRVGLRLHAFQTGLAK